MVDSNLSRFAGVSESLQVTARRRNPERSEVEALRRRPSRLPKSRAQRGSQKNSGGHCRTRTCDLVRVKHAL